MLVSLGESTSCRILRQHNTGMVLRGKKSRERQNAPGTSYQLRLTLILIRKPRRKGGRDGRNMR